MYIQCDQGLSDFYRAWEHYITLYKLHSTVSCLYFMLAYRAPKEGKGEGEKAGKGVEV